jgi:hypothetical protein
MFVSQQPFLLLYVTAHPFSLEELLFSAALFSLNLVKEARVLSVKTSDECCGRGAELGYQHMSGSHLLCI